MRMRRALAGAVAAVAIVAGGGAALAAATSSSPKAESAAIVKDAADRLGVTPAKLDEALRDAYAARVDAAVKAGKLTQAQGDAIKQRIQSADYPVLGLRAGGREFDRGFGHGFRGDRICAPLPR